MKKKHFLFLAMALTVFAMSFTFTACGSDDDDDGGGSSSSGQWYIPQSAISYKVSELSEGINSYDEIGDTKKQSDFFDSEGRFYYPSINNNGSSGIIYGNPVEFNTDGLAAIHIINGNTLEACFAARTWKLWSSGTVGRTLLFSMDMGYVGLLGRYAEYTRIFTYYPDGSGFWFGDEYEGVFEFNRANGQLYMSGGSGYWVQYNPDEVHKGSVYY